jgi:methylase of polypeptide subunit release factors
MREQGSGASVTLDTADRAGIELLREALVTGEYDVTHVQPLLRGQGDALGARPSDVPIVERLLPEGTRLAALMRLFMLGVATSEADARAALGALSLDAALRLGIIRRSADGIEGAVHIVPLGDYLFVSDRIPDSWLGLRPDHVMGVAPSSDLLASLTIRQPVERALDVGSGCGIQAVLAARHSQKVIACDVNPRALNFTAFNALLNGADNVECRAGSFFEPVKGERFDLIVSNPPFVISPEVEVTFRDGGMHHDDVSRYVLRGAAAHLREGGLAFVLMNWGIEDGGRWPDRLRPWVADLPCDIWLLLHSYDAPLFYAASWNSPLGSRPSEYAAAIDRWTKYLGEIGFASIGYGAAILRRRSNTTNWVRFDDLGGQTEPASGEQVAQLIANQDYLASLDDDVALLDARLALLPDHRLEQVLRWQNGGAAVEAATLRHETGFRFPLSVDAFAAQLLSRLEGHTLREAVHAAAADHFATKAIDHAALERNAVQFAKMTLGLGYTHVIGGRAN